ncbi:MAG: hypothetical protein ACJAVK_001263 [Akkermansiaceae bacterium]|jgi:hypothetical protein
MRTAEGSGTALGSTLPSAPKRLVVKAPKQLETIKILVTNSFIGGLLIRTDHSENKYFLRNK